VHGRRSGLLQHATSALINPLVILLSVLALISLSVGDVRAAVIMAVVREGGTSDIPQRLLVQGDLIRLSAGDLVPADVRLISAKDLFVNQATMTGEVLPVEKHALSAEPPSESALDLQNICFFGTSVVSGTATALVLATGGATYFGSMATHLADNAPVVSSFDQGLNRFTWLLLRFMAVMVPLVFLINGIGKGSWLEAFLFTLSVAVGLTPEMQPMIVTVGLSKGAIAMSHQKPRVPLPTFGGRGMGERRTSRRPLSLDSRFPAALACLVSSYMVRSSYAKDHSPSLEPVPDASRQFTAVFNAVCALGWQQQITNGVKLHHATYYPLKADYPALVSDLLIQAREGHRGRQERVRIAEGRLEGQHARFACLPTALQPTYLHSGLGKSDCPHEYDGWAGDKRSGSLFLTTALRMRAI
jgi:hypothetical protein